MNSVRSVPVRVAFRYGDTRLFSRLVCLLRGGDSAHCEVTYGWELGQRYCVSSSFLDGGVRVKRIELDPAKWRVYEIDAKTHPLDWVGAHVGKGYDILGLLGVVLPTFGHSRRRWFCSEAAADMLGLAPAHIFDLRALESVCARYGKRVQ